MASDGTAEPASAGSAAPDFAAFEAAENTRALGGESPGPAAPATVTTPDPEADEQEGHDEQVAEATDLGSSGAPIKVAPAPTPEKPISKRQQQINDLIRARAASDQRAKALEDKLAALEAKQAPAAEPKAPEKAAVVDASDPEPQEADFETYGAFVLAAAKWATRQAKREADAADKEAKAAEAETAAEAEFKKRTSTWTERRDAFAATSPEFVEKAIPFLDHVRAGTVIGDALIDSEVGPQLALYLATHPDEVSRIARLDPAPAFRALGKLEAQFEPMTSASASAGPAARTVTKAPAPPTTLSARSADPADPVAAALERGDFGAFEREENRRALAASR